jgi:deoxyribodipyrimidine photo-lyase
MNNDTRVKRLNSNGIQQGEYLLYWMQASQRVEENHALEYATKKANELDLPVLCVFCLTSEFAEASLRHYQFMIEGLNEVSRTLEDRKVGFAMVLGAPFERIPQLAEAASLVVVDRDYLRLQRQWRTQVAKQISCSLVQVETNVIVPIEEASNKEEYAAYTIRPKIQKLLDRYLVEVETHTPQRAFRDSLISDIEHFSPQDAFNQIEVDQDVKPVDWIQGGTDNAKSRLVHFIEKKLDHFDTKRNDPSEDFLSNMSPYLHFGQISPLFIALTVMETDSPGAESYLEELIIRRELSMNFVYYNEHYDSLNCLPNWARTTLKTHADDERESVYSLEEFENAETHDAYWNAAQREMVKRGKMHGYMRMYWGKKILEWTDTPEKAHEIALHLNNKYEIDGRDPNGYTGVAWCFGKHDRAWKERPIFGKVRYMNARGLERKFDIESYVKNVN